MQSWPNLRYYIRICLSILEKTIPNLGQESQCRGQDSNHAVPEHKPEALPLELTCSVIVDITRKLPSNALKKANSCLCITNVKLRTI
jgi:hypothetical protein